MRAVLLTQLVRIVEQLIRSGRIAISPALDCHVEYVAGGAARVGGGAAGEHRAARACIRPRRSPINVCVYDSTWEASDAFVLDNFEAVSALVKNEHLGFEVLYVYRGVVRKYRPDFLVRLAAGDMLVLENRGHHTEHDHVKRRYLDEWTQDVNMHGGFGRWRAAVAKTSGEILDILMQVSTARAGYEQPVAVDDLLRTNR